MSGDSLSPEKLTAQLEKGQWAPFYLFYGSDEFRMERSLNRIRQGLISEEAKPFNLHIFYAGKPGSPDRAEPGEILDAACSYPFIASQRLVIVRRVDEFTAKDLEMFLTYLDNPMESTCLIFAGSKADFRLKFYQKIKGLGRAVHFRDLYENQVVSWIKGLSADLGLNIDEEGCRCLRDIVGNRLQDLNAELEKLSLHYGSDPVGAEEVKSLAIQSRIHTVFELMDEISSKNSAKALFKLNKFLEQGDEKAHLKLVGMLDRQLRLLWTTKAVLSAGGGRAEVGNRLKLLSFQTEKLLKQSEMWKEKELEKAYRLLYEADLRLKSGSPVFLVLENLVLNLCL